MRYGRFQTNNPLSYGWEEKGQLIVEISIMIKAMVWNKYLQEEGLGKYPEIVKLFDSDSEAIKLNRNQ